MSADLQTKIHNFLIDAEERHINATTVVHQGLEENPLDSEKRVEN